jgi:hypothetical protein
MNNYRKQILNLESFDKLFPDHLRVDLSFYDQPVVLFYNFHTMGRNIDFCNTKKCGYG